MAYIANVSPQEYTERNDSKMANESKVRHQAKGGIRAFPVHITKSRGREDSSAGPSWTIESNLPVAQVEIKLSEKIATGILKAEIGPKKGSVHCEWTAAVNGTTQQPVKTGNMKIGFKIAQETDSVTVGVRRKQGAGTCIATHLHFDPAVQRSGPDRLRPESPQTGDPGSLVPTTPPPSASPSPTPVAS
ncbi:hypothetical protein [Actinomadura sp. NTSP31]|uniref:hypothetical protein n=1 Tax=Actinomadura sp. NTSP31 TaxID=1735447 RepID=UPI0035BF91BE